MRLIDAHKLQKAIYEHKTVRSITKDKVVETIKEQPTVDPVKHGRWLSDGALFGGVPFYCSVCKFGKYVRDGRRYYFCPNCGAKMDEEADHDDHL